MDAAHGDAVPETPDPVAALSAPDIPTRAAGARDLAITGTLAHIRQMIQMSISDPSSGVRLYCAGAAADILSRYRNHAELPLSERETLFQPIKISEPSLNPGLFQVAAELNVPGSLSRILGGMRDPRVDVRIGACVGLLRCCQQGRSNGDQTLEKQVVALLSDIRIKPDTRAEIARICAYVSYASALAQVSNLAESIEGKPGEVLVEARDRLLEPGSAQGFWVEAGRDAGEVVAKLRLGQTVIWLQNQLWDSHFESVPAPNTRRLWLKEPGWESHGPVLQVGPQTYYAADSDDICGVADALLATDREDIEALFAPLWPDDATGRRCRGALALRRGRTEEALSLLSEALELKKVPADTAWWMAETLSRLGRDEEARLHLERFVAKAAKKHPSLAEARRRLGL